ncbi:MAG: type II toxin-antitoxin system VapC family toxin [Anaerolineales bacterium]|nr:type II toxin-antitoxin system VapC family toxin [Anaerolineales bacterium]
MNVVDSSGWVAYFANGGNAQFFAAPIQDVAHLLVPSICVYEVFKRLAQELGEESALQAVGVMSYGAIIDLDREIALDAAQISMRHKLAMADSIILATARAYEAALWTQDVHFKDIEGVQYIGKQ